jgi:hypothetical protein
VEWPGPADAPQFRSEHGIQHYYAPLQIITVNNNGTIEPTANGDLRRFFRPCLIEASA